MEYVPPRTMPRSLESSGLGYTCSTRSDYRRRPVGVYHDVHLRLFERWQTNFFGDVVGGNLKAYIRRVEGGERT
jgi:hypothetical protein